MARTSAGGVTELQIQNSTHSYAADAGGTDDYAITLNPAVTAYATGQRFAFKANTANTTGATLNVNGLGTKTIVKHFNATLATNDIKAGSIVEVYYDGTNFQMVSMLSQAPAGSGDMQASTYDALGIAGQIAGRDYANSFTKSQAIKADSDAMSLAVRRNAAGQSAKILEIQSEVNATLASFDKDGNLAATNFSGSSSGTNTGDNATNSQYSGQAALIAGKENYHGIEAHGALSFDAGTHILTVAGGTNTYWFQGVKYTTASAITCDIDSYETLTANTLYFIAFDDATGTLKASDAPWGLKTHVPVATVFWNGSAGAVSDETHGHTRDLDWHTWAHLTVGARYGAGLDLTLPTTTTDGSLQIESGSIYDEDISFTIGQQTTMRAFYQASLGVYTYADYALPYLGTAGAPVFLDTDTYSLATFAAGDFACYWVYGTTDIARPIYIIPSQRSAAHTTLNNARAETPPTLSGLNLAPEMKLLYRFIFAGNGQFQESADYRLTSPLPSGGSASTTASAVSFAPSGNIASTTVQTALEELDTEKAAIAQTMYIGTTQVAINRGSAALTLAGLTLTTPDIGTPSGGTLTNCSGLPLSGVVDSTSEALGVGTLELGAASDTTLSRSAAGVLAVEGVVIPSISSTNTLTNKRVTPRILSATSYTTDTGTSLNADNYDIFSVTAQAGALLFNAPGGTPTDGQKLIITVASSTTAARALTWNAIFEASTVALPTTTAATTAQLNIGFMYSAGRTKWVCVAVA